MGTDEGMILLYQNERIINQFDGCNGNSVRLGAILFDPIGFMAKKCDKLYLFSPDGSFTGKTLTINSQYINFDSKGRFIQISEKQISIYN